VEKKGGVKRGRKEEGEVGSGMYCTRVRVRIRGGRRGRIVRKEVEVKTDEQGSR